MKQIERKAVYLWDGEDRHHFGFYIAADVPDDMIKNVHEHCSITNVVLTVFETLAEVDENNAKKLRQSAWDKLTHLERAAIGLTKP